MAVKSFYTLFSLKTVFSSKTVKFFDTFSLLGKKKKLVASHNDKSSLMDIVLMNYHR